MDTGQPTATPDTQLALRQSQALAEQQAKHQAAMVAIFGATVDKELHNFDGDQRRVYQLKALCSSPEVLPLEDSVGEPLSIRYFYGSVYEHEDVSTGEITERMRMVLVDINGICYKTASPYVAREIGRAVSVFGCKPFDPPLNVRFVEGKGRDGRKFHTLSPVL